MSAQPLIVGLVGLAGAGKSTAARLIVEEFVFELIKPGDHIKSRLMDSKLLVSPENERHLQLLMRQEYGMSALLDLCIPEIEEALSRKSNVLIDSMCSFSEKESLLRITSPNSLSVVAVHAPAETRKLYLGARSVRPLSAEQMAQRDMLEIDLLEKGKMLSLADHHVVNNGEPVMLEQSMRALMRSLGAVSRTGSGGSVS